MKKNFTTFILLFTCLWAQAQITITANDVAGVGSIAMQATDTLIDESIKPGSTGNLSWNFSALNANELSTTVFVAPSATPFPNLFPSANLVAVQDSFNYAYMSKTTASLDIVGLLFFGVEGGDSISFISKYSDPESLIRFPATYNSGFNDVSASRIEVPGSIAGLPFDSIRVATSTQATAVFDAFGMITTPAGTFESLRLTNKKVNTEIISVKLFGVWSAIDTSIDSLVEYTWWTNSNNVGFPVVQLEADAESGAVFSATWLSNIMVNNNELYQTIDFNVYPNPAVATVEVQLPEAIIGYMEVIDFNGKLALRQAIDNQTASFTVSNWPAGAYVVILRNTDGSLRGFKQLQVVR